MTSRVAWLPSLVLLEKHHGDWDCYLSVLYAFFKADFLDSSPTFRRLKVAVKRCPVAEGKEAAFWHLISTGKEESERLPDLRRCERIRWPRPIIEHSEEPTVRVWSNKRKSKRRVCLWLEDWEYLVVLEERRDYVLLWTAYPVTRAHQQRKLRKEYEDYKRTGAAPEDGAVTPSTPGR